jgi:hypothetical protein
MGYMAVEEAAHRVYRALAERGLATETKDGVSIPMHPGVRTVYLMILAQLARDARTRHGLDLHPVRNGQGIDEAQRTFLELPPTPTRGHVVAFDLHVVSVDLARVPLDEVLQFRNENRSAHRKYMEDLRNFAQGLSLSENVDRRRALRDRRDDLKDQARALNRLSRQAWKSPSRVSGFGLGLTGATYAAATGSLVPGIIGALTAALSMLPDPPNVSAYSYLFKAARRLR